MNKTVHSGTVITGYFLLLFYTLCILFNVAAVYVRYYNINNFLELVVAFSGFFYVCIVLYGVYEGNSWITGKRLKIFICLLLLGIFEFLYFDRGKLMCSCMVNEAFWDAYLRLMSLALLSVANGYLVFKTVWLLKRYFSLFPDGETRPSRLEGPDEI